MNKLNMKKLIETIKKVKYSEWGNPDSEQVLNYNKILIKHGLPKLPEEMLEFYNYIDGYLWNGIIIFPLNKIILEDSDYIPDSLVDFNIKLHRSKKSSYLMIGRSDEDIYIYDDDSKQYSILDRTGFDEYYSFKSFMELFLFVLEERGVKIK